MQTRVQEVGRWTALLVLAFLQTVWLIQDTPTVVRAAHMILIGVAVWRPTWALVSTAALGPVLTTLAAVMGSPFVGARHLEAMVLAVITGVVFSWRSGVPTRTGWPAFALACTALVSAAAIYPVRKLQFAADVPWSSLLSALLSHGYFQRDPFWDPLFFALLAVEGAALAWAVEYLGRREASRTPAQTIAWPTYVIAAAFTGHVFAAAINVDRVVSAARRTESFATSFWTLFTSVRVHAQYDVNAAASVLVMVALASAGLWTWRRTWWYVPGLLLLLAGLWLTGSRIAMASLLVAALATTLVTSLRSGRVHTRKAVIAAVAVAAIAAAGVWAYPARRNLNISASVESRAVLFRTGVNMVRDAPVTGIGVGRFLELSDAYGSADISRILEVARTRDNAHNYFLQVFAELGVIGFAAFLWLLWAAIGGALRRWPSASSQHRWMLGGLLGMMGTWLTGHPLLVPDAAHMFWIVAGLVAASPATGPAARRWGPGVACLLLAGLVATLPWQTEGQRRRAALEHLGVGLSAWHLSEAGVRYRDAGQTFSLFLPQGQLILLPMRAPDDAESPVGVSVRVNGREIDLVTATRDEWREVRLRVPEHRQRFVRVDFAVVSLEGALSPCAPCLHVGRQSTPGLPR